MQGGGLAGLQPREIFAKVDLLLIDTDSEKNKNNNKMQTSSNSLETSGNMTLVHFI